MTTFTINPRVIISDDYSVMKNFVENRDSISEVTNLFKTGYLLDTSINDSLLSLEYTVGGDKRKPPLIVLKFLDISKEFEENLLATFKEEKIIINSIGELLTNLNNTSFTNKKTIYIYFGVGDDPSDWGGPFTCVLTDADITINNLGARIYTFNFTSNLREYYNYEKEDLGAVQGVNNIEIKNLELTDNLQLISMENNIEEMIVSFFTSYFNQDLKDNNLIFIFPSLEGIRTWLAELFKERRVDQSSWIPNIDLFPKTRPGVFGEPVPIPRSDKVLSDFAKEKNNIIPSIKEKYLTFGIILKYYIANLTEVKIGGWEGFFRRLVFNGTEITDNNYVRNDPKNQVININLDTADPVVVIPRESNRTPISPYEFVQFNANEIANTPKMRLSMKAESDATSEIPNIQRLLDNLTTGFSILNSNNSDGPCIITSETNLNILKIYKKYGLIKDESKPAIIIGMENLIQKVLFAKTAYTEEDRILSNNNTVIGGTLIRRKISNIFRGPMINGFGKNASTMVNKGRLEYLEDINFYIQPKKQRESNTNLQTAVGVNNIDHYFRFGLPDSNILDLSVDLQHRYFTVVNTVIKDTDEDRGISKLADAAMKIVSFTKLLKEIQDLHIEVEKIAADIPRWHREYEPEEKTPEGLIRNYLESNKTSKDAKKIIDIFTAGNLDFENYIINSEVVAALKDKNKLGILELITFVKYILIVVGTSKADLLINAVGGEGKSLPVIRNFNKSFGIGAASLSKRMIDEMAKQVFNISIKTLPKFNISRRNDLAAPCLVEAARQRVISFRNTRDMENLDFITGIYTILGFRHTITNREVFSEFTLMRRST